MKNLKINYVLLLLALVISLFSCENKDCIDMYETQIYEPVYTSWTEIIGSIGSEEPRGIKSPGKIFAIGSLLFISEVNKGIHVIDNSDATNPQNIKFINIPGSLDIAVFGNRLFTDNYSDIIELDISDIHNAVEIARVENVFESNSTGYFDYSEEGIITDWTSRDTIIEYDCNQDIFYDEVFNDITVLANGQETNFDASNLNGKAGSMARFALYSSKLYALNQYQLNIFDIGDEFELGNTMDIEWGVETLFPYQNYLFVGANNGMHILDISIPLQPQWVSTYTHINSCDPVVIKDDIAYVTLRSGNDCQNFTNQLEVIDVSDKSNPNLLKTYEMFNPHGLGTTNTDLLFICDGDEGLKVYDNTDYLDIKLKQHYADINAFDVIPYNDKLLMIGSDGFYQYDYSDIEDIHLISYIPVVE